MEVQVEKDPDFIVDAGKKAAPLSTYSRKRKSGGGGEDRKDVKKSKPAKASDRKPTAATAAKRRSELQHHQPHHPPYLEMITEAIVALNERNGSSLPAIAKYLKASIHGDELPDNFRKMLSLQLKHQVDKGNLIRIKNSFKLSPSMRRAATQSLRVDSARKNKPRKAKRASRA